MKLVQSESRVGVKGGFTLLELVLAVAIGAMVLTSIFKIADGAVRSTAKMVEYQDEDITRDAFFSFLRNHFDNLPGNAVLDLRNTSNAEPFLSEMTFQNTPVSFNWGGVPISAQATRFVTMPTATNGVDVVLEYYDVPILDSDEGPAELGIDPIATVTLLYDVRLFEWNVMDIRNYENTDRDDWPYDWDTPNRRPGYVELTIVFQNGDSPVKRLFWIPTKANPQTTMSALQNAARGARQNGGTGGTPATGGTGGNPQIGGAGGNPATGRRVNGQPMGSNPAQSQR